MNNNTPFLALKVSNKTSLAKKIIGIIFNFFSKTRKNNKTVIDILEAKIIDLVNPNTARIVYGFMSGEFYKKQETITAEDWKDLARDKDLPAKLMASLNQDDEKIKNLTVEDFLNSWFYRHRLNPHFCDQVMHLAFSDALGKFLYTALGENFMDFCAKVSTLGYEYMDFSATLISLIARHKAFEERMLEDINRAKASGWKPSTS